MQKNYINLRNIYALFALSNPEILEPFKARIPEHEIVAARLISCAHHLDASIRIKNIDDEQSKFKLDLESRIYQSKGNWIWVEQLDIYFPETILLTISISPRVLDLPYTNNNICAHWLFRNIAQELNKLLNTYL